MNGTLRHVACFRKLLSLIVLAPLSCSFASSAEAAITLVDDVVPSPPVGDPWNVGGPLTVGETLSGTMTVDAGSDVSNTDGFVANFADSTGAVTIDGAGSTWRSSGELRMGNSGTGTLNITGGGAVSVGGNARFGNLAGGTGTTTVDGAGSTLTGDALILVGREGIGTLHIQNSGAVTDTIGGIAIIEGSSGAATVDGTGSTWNNLNELQVADGGTATLDITNGGVVSSPFGYIANAPDGIGTVTVSGSGSAWNSTMQFQIGYGGHGTLNISDAATVSGNLAYIGVLAGGNGTATIDGAGSAWTNSDVLSVGYEGTGALHITGGGSVSNSNGILGNLAGSSGTATIHGAGSTWNNSGALTVGSLGTGTLRIEHGGQAIATALDGTGGVTFDGGTLRVLAADSTNNPLTLDAGGGTLDVAMSAATVTVTSDVDGAGGLSKAGVGTLDLSGTNSYSGSTRIDAGTLNIHEAYLNDLADVYLASGTSFGLNFTGTDQIDSLFIAGAAKEMGTYGAIGSGADVELDLFSGSGLLRVTKVGLLGDYNDNGIPRRRRLHRLARPIGQRHLAPERRLPRRRCRRLRPLEISLRRNRWRGWPRTGEYSGSRAVRRTAVHPGGDRPITLPRPAHRLNPTSPLDHQRTRRAHRLRFRSPHRAAPSINLNSGPEPPKLIHPIVDVVDCGIDRFLHRCCRQLRRRFFAKCSRSSRTRREPRRQRRVHGPRIHSRSTATSSWRRYGSMRPMAVCRSTNTLPPDDFGYSA